MLIKLEKCGEKYFVFHMRGNAEMYLVRYNRGVYYWSDNFNQAELYTLKTATKHCAELRTRNIF